MGIPKFFRWLVGRYPCIVQGVPDRGCGGESLVDELYVDLNGILHPATAGAAADGADEDAVFRAVFEHLDHLVRLAAGR